MRIARGDAVALTRALVACDSRNPLLVPGGPGEQAVATLLAGVLESWGFAIEVIETETGRPSILARSGRGGAPALMFNGHIDVVGVEGMVHDPWSAEERDGRIYGRGASDMKAGVAAMCAAAALADGDDGEILIAAVADEEYRSDGTRTLMDRKVRAEAAIVTEPTGLAIMPAHKGFVWLNVDVQGRAAHGSRWDLGIDAIRNAGHLLVELDRLDAEELPRRTHPLLGRASLHASMIGGGSGMSTYPEACVIRFERRTLPGETPMGVQAEMERACEAVRARRDDFSADVTMVLSQNPSDVDPGAPVCRALSAALSAEGITPRVEGMSAWTDAALLNDAGIPAICFGPGDMGLAHAAEEYVAVDEIRRATAVLTRLASDWRRGDRSAWHS